MLDVASPELAVSQRPRSRPSVIAGVGGGVAVLVLFALGLVLYVAIGGAQAPDGSDFTLGALIAGLSFGLPGAVLVVRSDVPSVGWVCLAAGLSLTLSGALTGWAAYGVSTQPGSLPGAEAALWLSNWCWVPGYGLVVTNCCSFSPLVASTRDPGVPWRLSARSQSPPPRRAWPFPRIRFGIYRRRLPATRTRSRSQDWGVH